MSRVTRLTIVLILNLLLIAALVIVGLRAHSIGVLAEGGDYLADAAAICVSLLAIWLANRPSTAKRPYGYPRATNIAALVNGGWLFVVSVLVVAGAVRRLATRTPHVNGLPVLIVSGIAAVLMVIGAAVLGGDIDNDHDDDVDLNMRAVLLDTAADAAAATSVAATGGVILATGGWYWLDPAVALLVAAIIGYHVIVLLRHVVAALRAPTAAIN